MRSLLVRSVLRAHPQLTIYDDPPPGGGGGGGNGDPPPGGGDPPGGGPGGGGATDDKPTLTQKQFNDAIAKEKKVWETRTQQQIQQLEQLKKAKGLTDKEKEGLQTQIEELSRSMLSKEEIAKRDKETMSQQHRAELEREKKERESWQVRYSTEKINRTILDAASEAKGLVPRQFVEVLAPKARLVEVLDGEGKPTGDWEPMVTLIGQDKEGKPVKLDLSVKDAIKQMKDMTEYGNFFQNTAAGGLGGGREGSGGRGSGKAPQDMGTAEYREFRKKNRGVR